MRREPRGDGRTATCHLEPCRCPSCDGELVITCAQGCPDAADGASGYVDPAARLPKPSGRQPALRAPRPPRVPRGRRGRIIGLLAQHPSVPLGAKYVAAALGDDALVVAVELAALFRAGRVTRPARGLYQAAA